MPRNTETKPKKGLNALMKINAEARKLKSKNPNLSHQEAISIASQRYREGKI